MQPFYFRAEGRALFGVLHQAASPRALLLLCPPLLHEHVRSHRFFSQLAGRLAQAGVSCLRFDYFGTGDSGGEDAQFEPAVALRDIAAAARELRAREGAYPLVLMGVRGSALLAAAAASAVDAQALWLWQPECDGPRYLASLEAQDLAARSDQNRFPGRALPLPADPAVLLGFRVSPRLRDGLSGLPPVQALPDLPVALVGGPEQALPDIPHASRHRLPATASDWADEIDLRSTIQLRDAETVIEALLARLPAPCPVRAQGVAHG